MRCVGYPAAEYGVLPFAEREIHWSLSPDIKESIDDITPQGLVLDTQAEKNHTQCGSLTPVDPPTPTPYTFHSIFSYVK